MDNNLKKQVLNTFDFSGYESLFGVSSDEVISRMKNIDVKQDLTTYFTIKNYRGEMALFRASKGMNFTICRRLLPFENRKIVKIFPNNSTYACETMNMDTGNRGVFIGRDFFIPEKYDEIKKDKDLKFLYRKGSLWGRKDINWSNDGIPVAFESIERIKSGIHEYNGVPKQIKCPSYIEVFKVSRDGYYGAYCYYNRNGNFNVYKIPLIFKSIDFWNATVIDNNPFIYFKVETNEGFTFYDVVKDCCMSSQMFKSVSDVEYGFDLSCDIEKLGLCNLLSGKFYGKIENETHIISKQSSNINMEKIDRKLQKVKKLGGL